MPIQIKLGRKPIDIKYDDLKAMIARGEIGPSVLIKGNILTDDEWWTIDNAWIFHKCSPVAYPYGEKLKKQMEHKSRRKIRGHLIGTLWYQYTHGDLMELSYCLEPLDQIIREQDVIGVSRLFYLPSFEPEKIFTFVFKSSLVKIEAVEGATSLISSLPLFVTEVSNSEPMKGTSISQFRSSQQIREMGSLKKKNLPKPIRSWEQFVACIHESGETECLSLDGEAFRHKVMNDEVSTDVWWHNPHPRSFPAQNKLIRWYRDCTDLVGLEKFWAHTHTQRRREERERNLLRFRDWARENYPEIASQAVNDDGSVNYDIEDRKIYRRLYDEWKRETKGS